MKDFFRKFIIMLEEMGKARTAAYLTAMGHYKEAQALMKDVK